MLNTCQAVSDSEADAIIYYAGHFRNVLDSPPRMCCVLYIIDCGDAGMCL